METAMFRRSSTLFLRIVIVLIGIGVLAFLLWEPHIEGRNAHATLFEIYFNDPFLAYAYTASIAFFVALYQAFRLFGHIGHNKAFSYNSFVHETATFAAGCRSPLILRQSPVQNS